MAASLHSSKTSTTDRLQDHDPETAGKAVSTPTESDLNANEKNSPWEATLEKNEDPKNMATWYKWVIVLTISAGAMCVTSASSIVSDILPSPTGSLI